MGYTTKTLPLQLQRDSTQKHVKNLDVVLGADTSVLILDDTEGVWPQHSANLIQVDRYIFFPACATRFGRSHKCLLEKGKDEDADTGMLSTALRVLKQVHMHVFEVMLLGTGFWHMSHWDGDCMRAFVGKYGAILTVAIAFQVAP